MVLRVNRTISYNLPVVRFELFRKEDAYTIKSNLLVSVLCLLKNHFKYQFKILSCISGLDYPRQKYRFQVVYDLLSVKYNSRVRVKVYAGELLPLDSIEKVYKAASWWESEVWDMFGVHFLNNYELRRILTDYGFYGYPLRKDFPLSGFYERRYNKVKCRVVSEDIELAQEFRTFDTNSAWDSYFSI